MSRSLQLVLLAAALVGLGGCASSQANTQPSPSAQAQGHEACAMCPMKVEGTQVTAADVEGGVALTFTTATGDVGALRARVAQMAERHNAHHAGAPTQEAGGCPHAGQAGAPATCPQEKADGQQGCCAQGGHGGHGHHGKHGGMGKPMGMPMMAAKASVEEVPGGARMVLKTDDAAAVETLRQHVHQHAEMMSKGGCGCRSMQGAHGS